MNNSTIHKSRMQKRRPGKKVPMLDEGDGNMLAGLIRSHPELWCKKDIGHGNQGLKNEVWGEIAATIPGWTAQMAEQHFHSARTQYGKNIKKRERERTEGNQLNINRYQFLGVDVARNKKMQRRRGPQTEAPPSVNPEALPSLIPEDLQSVNPEPFPSVTPEQPEVIMVESQTVEQEMHLNQIVDISTYLNQTMMGFTPDEVAMFFQGCSTVIDQVYQSRQPTQPVNQPTPPTTPDDDSITDIFSLMTDSGISLMPTSFQ